MKLALLAAAALLGLAAKQSPAHAPETDHAPRDTPGSADMGAAGIPAPAPECEVWIVRAARTVARPIRWLHRQIAPVIHWLRQHMPVVRLVSNAHPRLKVATDNLRDALNVYDQAVAIAR